MSRISVSILLDQLKYKGSSQACDSVNKNKALLGRQPVFLIAPDYEDSRARGFIQRSLDLHPFCGNPISLILLTNV
ncbi:hypothetical protein Tco_1572232 [Tanacetum coccineum]